MKRFATMVLVVLMAAGVALAGGYEVKKTVDGLKVEMEIDKNPPVVGKNNISVELEDETGKYLTDADVVVNYSMPPMTGMPPMNYTANAVLKGEKYVAVMDLSMSGSWNIAVKITRGGKTSTARFTVDAR